MRRCTLGIVLLTLVGVLIAGDAPKPPPVTEPRLRVELIRRAKADQDARRSSTERMIQFGNKEFGTLNATQKAEVKKLADALRRVDAENTERLGKIVEQHGWPTYTLVGKDGANSAWLLVQHADLSPRFQRKCLDLMVKVPRNQISQKDVAYLTDRVLLAECKKQIYGTQFTLENGKCKPRPLEDAANVDKRRAEVGLPPLAVYLKQSEAFYNGSPKK